VSGFISPFNYGLGVQIVYYYCHEQTKSKGALPILCNVDAYEITQSLLMAIYASTLQRIGKAHLDLVCYNVFMERYQYFYDISRVIAMSKLIRLLLLYTKGCK